MSEDVVLVKNVKPHHWYKHTTKEGVKSFVYVQSVYEELSYTNRLPLELHFLSVPIKSKGQDTVAPPFTDYARYSTTEPFGTLYTKDFPKTVAARLQERVFRGVCDLPGLETTVNLGSDPEVFVVDGEGKVIPAWKFLPKKPLPSSLEGSVFWDGFQAEMTTQPRTCLAYHVDGIYDGLCRISTAAKKYNPAATLSWQCVHPVEAQDLLEGKDEHVQLGCAPSQNIYEEFHPPVTSGRDLPIRFAGCHFHFGLYVKGLSFDPQKIQSAVTGMDLIGGVLATLVLQGLEHPARRQYYGRPGEYRVSKDLTRLEYRAISSAALVHPAVTHLIFDLVRIGWRLGFSRTLSLLWDASPSYVREAMINLDIPACKKVMKKNLPILTRLVERYYGAGSAPKALSVFDVGIKEFIDTAPGAMEKAWRITNKTWSTHSDGRECFFKSFLGHNTKLIAATESA